MTLASYEDWKHCISVSCGIPLTLDYIERRIRDLSDPGNSHTRKFIDHWGEEHRAYVLACFERARQESPA